MYKAVKAAAQRHRWGRAKKPNTKTVTSDCATAESTMVKGHYVATNHYAVAEQAALG